MKTLLALTAALALALAPLSSARADDPTDATFSWVMNGEVQGLPFFGGVNYLSAGISDGTQASYSATDQDVTILQRSATGATAAASWDTRAAHVGGTGLAAQLVTLAGGDVTVAADGALDIRWTGAWSVNMYGGLAPYTLSAPHLLVDATGTGTLRADLGGYAGVIGSSAPATPVAPVADVAIATFHGVTVDTTAGFTVTPDFAGVAVTVPVGATAQDTRAAGWGAWPQPFVDFQQVTGLGPYFYTSGSASTDPLKPPAAFSVGFGGAAPPAPIPTPTPTPTATATPTPEPGAETVKPTIAGTLLWGVKSSFRSYVTGSIAKGAITLSHGAATRRGVVAFGQAAGGSFTLATATGTSRYTGAVHFTGHGGILDITMSDPVVSVSSASRASLSLVVGGHRVTIGDVALKRGTRTERAGTVSYTGAPVTLTAAGSTIFSYAGSAFYPAGTAMDPLTFTIGKRSTARSTASTLGAYRTWTAPATPPATSGASLTGAPVAGGRVSITASGFAKNETGIRVVLYSDPLVLAENVTADAAGTVTVDVTIPTTLEGDHTLTLQGSVARGVAFTVAAAAALEGCTVTTASLTWGFKESFRSYISGTIANGEWTTSGDATYATPAFTFSNGSGVADTDAATATISFTGDIRFTGHDGALDLTISNPVYRQLDATNGELLVDVRSKALDGGAEVDANAVRFVTLALVTDGASVTAASATLTSEGAAAFAGFYTAGVAFDPLSIAVTLPASCTVAEPASAPVTPPAPTATAAATEPTPTTTVSPLRPLLLTLAAMLVVLGIVVVIVLRRATHERRASSRG